MSGSIRRLGDVAPPRAAWTAKSFLAACCFVGYLVIGHGFGDFYPISPLGMFRDQIDSSSRIVARPVGGAPIEIAYYVDWSCPKELDFSNDANPQCTPAGFSAYDSIVIDYILSHQGPPAAGEPVEILRRQFTVDGRGGPIRTEDCVLLSCTARRIQPSPWTPRL